MMRHAFLLCLFVFAAIALPCAASAQHQSAQSTPTWLWVKDYFTGIGVAGAAVDIAAGDQCLGQTQAGAVKWTAHYTTDAAGRVLTHGLPLKLSCRVTVNGTPLYVLTYGGEFSRARDLPSWIQLRSAFVTTINVSSQPRDDRTISEDYWGTTDDPTQFRSYIQNPDTAELISGVKITALPSGITTTSDGNGLFTLEIPASYRKGKPPWMATQTLVFSEPGYKTLEYRQLVLHPGLRPLAIFLPKGTGTLVRTNGSIHPGNPYDDKFAVYSGNAPKHPPAGRGEIISFEITPPISYDGTWIHCDEGTSAVLKARNLTQAYIGWTPTGTNMAGNGQSLSMKKVATSPDGDTWEVELPNVMSTNFAAGGTDKDGKNVSTMDIGNVGCE